MAGFLLAWTKPGQLPNAASWTRSLQWAGRQGLLPDTRQCGRVAMAAWHRPNGEFPFSGKITSTQGRQVAFIGQCLEEPGDASDIAINLIASANTSDAA